MSAACARPLELAALVDYWFDDAEPAEQERVEEHLMECEGCSARLRGLVALGEGVRRAAREGAVLVVVTPAFVETAARAGLRAREYRVPPGGRVACTVTPEDDLLLSRLEADFNGVSRLDVVSSWEGGLEQRLEDVPVSPDARELILAQSMPALRALGHAVVRLRLVAREERSERVLGEYTFLHSPTRS